MIHECLLGRIQTIQTEVQVLTTRFSPRVCTYKLSWTIILLESYSPAVLSIRTPMKDEAGGSLEPCSLRPVRSTWWGHFSKRKENGRRKGRKVSVGRMPSNSSPGWPVSWGWPWISDLSAFNSRTPRSQGGTATPGSCVAGCMLVKHFTNQATSGLASLNSISITVFIGVLCTCHGAWVESVLSFYQVGSKARTQVMGLWGKHLYPLSHPSQAPACFS